MANKIYGIPGCIASREIFYFNHGKGTLRVEFKNGSVDPGAKAPATFSTSSEAEQSIIENSEQFGLRVFEYSPQGRKLPSARKAQPTEEEKPRVKTKEEIEEDKTASRLGYTVAKDGTKVFEKITRLSEVSQILLELGATAKDMTGSKAILAAADRLGCSFPNLDLTPLKNK